MLNIIIELLTLDLFSRMDYNLCFDFRSSDK